MANPESNELTLLKQERARRQGLSAQQSQSEPPASDELAALYAEKERRKAAHSSENTSALNGQNSESTPQNGMFSQLGSEAKGIALNFLKSFVEGGGSLADLATQALQQNRPDDFYSSVNPISGDPSAEEIQRSNTPTVDLGIAEKLGKGVEGIVGEEIKPESGFQRVSSTVGSFAGGSLVPGGALAKNLATGAKIGLGSGVLQEGGMPKLAADLTALMGSIGLPGIKKMVDIFKNSKNLTEAEKNVAQYLQATMEQEGSSVSKAVQNIENSPKYDITGYEPTTAEVAEDVTLSNLHRLRQGQLGSGLSQRASTQNDAISKSVDSMTLDKISSEELKEAVGKELSSAKAKRHAETHEQYDEIHKETTQINPKNIEEFFKENAYVKGGKREELDKIKKLIEPSRKLTDSEKIALKRYEKSKKSILESKYSEEAKSKMIAELKKPKENYPTVGDLDEARQNINERLGELERAGRENSARLLRDAKKALDKDLEVFPKQAEVTAKYAELSEPVNAIAEHPLLSKLPESRLNDVMSNFYSRESYDNVVSLKKVFKGRPEDWKGFQDASLDYFMNYIKNAGSEGKGSVLSYAKLNRFLKNHEKALKEVFSEDQVSLLEEIKNAVKGKNVAETAGKEKGSETYGKLVKGTHLKEGTGGKILRGSTYLAHAVPKFGKALGEVARGRLDRYLKNKESDVMAVIDNVLKEPGYAKKILNHKFETQKDFNQYMNYIIKAAPVAARVSQDEKNN